MVQARSKRKKFGAIHAITPSRRLPRKSVKTPMKDSPTGRGRAFYKVLSKDIKNSIGVLVPADQRKNIRPARYMYGTPNALLLHPEKMDQIHSRLIRHNFNNKKFTHKLDELLGEFLGTRNKQAVLPGMKAGKPDNAYQFSSTPFYRQLLKEIKPMQKQLRLKNKSPEEILARVLTLEQLRREKLEDQVAGGASYDRIRIYGAKNQVMSALHEAGHNVLVQSMLSGKQVPKWKKELFANAFEMMTAYNFSIRSKQTAFDESAPRGILSKRESLKKALPMLPAEFRMKIEELKGQEKELSKKPKKERFANHQDMLDTLEAHITATEVMKKIFERKGHDVEETVKAVGKIVYNEKIKKPEDVKV